MVRTSKPINRSNIIKPLYIYISSTPCRLNSRHVWWWYVKECSFVNKKSMGLGWQRPKWPKRSIRRRMYAYRCVFHSTNPVNDVNPFNTWFFSCTVFNIFQHMLYPIYERCICDSSCPRKDITAIVSFCSKFPNTLVRMVEDLHLHALPHALVNVLWFGFQLLYMHSSPKSPKSSNIQISCMHKNIWGGAGSTTPMWANISWRMNANPCWSAVNYFGSVKKRSWMYVTQLFDLYCVHVKCIYEYVWMTIAITMQFLFYWGLA